jgi:hypothetical protein
MHRWKCDCVKFLFLCNYKHSLLLLLLLYIIYNIFVSGKNVLSTDYIHIKSFVRNLGFLTKQYFICYAYISLRSMCLPNFTLLAQIVYHISPSSLKLKVHFIQSSWFVLLAIKWLPEQNPQIYRNERVLSFITSGRYVTCHWHRFQSTGSWVHCVFVIHSTK